MEQVLWLFIVLVVLAILAELIGQWFLSFFFAAAFILSMVWVAKVTWKFKALAEGPVDFDPIEGIAFELPQTVGGALAVVLGLMFINAILAAALAGTEKRFDWRTLPEFLTHDVLWLSIVLVVLAVLAELIGQWFLSFYFAATAILAMVWAAKVTYKFRALVERAKQNE